MSRHRDVRNLDIEAELNQDNFDEEPPILTAEQEVQMKVGVKKVYDVIGEDSGLPREKVEETLWYYYFDVEASVDYLLKEIANIKKTKKKTNKAKDDDDEIDELLAFCSHDDDTKLRSVPQNSLLSLNTNQTTLNSANHTSSNDKPTLSDLLSSKSSAKRVPLNSRSSNLPTLADLLNSKSSDNKASQNSSNPMPSLATLSLNTPKATTNSNLSGLSKMCLGIKPSLASLSTAANVNQRNDTPSLAALLSNSSLNSLKSTTHNLNSDKNFKSGTQSSLQQLALNTATKTDPLSSLLLKKSSQQLAFLKKPDPTPKPEEKINIESTFSHPSLLSVPSSMGKTIVAPTIPKLASLKKSFTGTNAFTSYGLILESSKSANPPIKPSKFNSASPDDIVLKAQSKSSTLNKANKPMVPKPSPKPVSKPLNQLELDMQAMSLSSASSPELASTPIPNNKRIDVVKAYLERNQQKSNLNLIIVGHVDAGKSTLTGHLLYKMGKVDERTMRRFERESEKLGKKSFAYAWVLDETSEERERGVTVDIATAQFQTEVFNVTVLDAPGHKDFIPNMISGANQADVAVLVVDATSGEFESGFQGQGQTREHALLIRSLGVKQLIVAINKLDTTRWSEARFEEIRQQLHEFLTSAGFPTTGLTFVPVSGLHGHNLEQPAPADHPLRSWYKGPSLIQAIDQFDPPSRPVELALRLPVSDFFKGGIGNVSGVTVSGRIVQGHLQLGETLRILPGDEQATVKYIEVDETSVEWAVAGDSVLVTLANLDILQLRPGSILCKPDSIVPVTNKFQAQILVFTPSQPITLGTSVVVHHQSLDLPGNFVELVATLDKSTGQVLRSKPRMLTKQASAIVTIQTLNGLAIESFDKCKELARVTFRKNGVTIATGIVQKILPMVTN